MPLLSSAIRQGRTEFDFNVVKKLQYLKQFQLNMDL
jgi:hypothetical protein